MAGNLHWTLEVDADRIAWLSFDAPGASVNVLSSAAVREFEGRIGEIAALRPAGLVIRSAKPGGFILGADIKEFTAIQTPAQGLEMVRAGQRAFDRLEALPCPSVAAIHGAALGGGCELALACTYRIGADDAKLSIGLPEVQLGIHPGFGGTVRSVRLLGVRVAMDLMLKGRPFQAARALQTGLVDRLAPPAELAAEAKRLLRLAPRRRSAPALDRLLNLAPIRPLLARRLAAAVRAKASEGQYPAPFAIVELWRRHGARGATAYQAEAESIGRLMCSPSSRNLVRVFLLQDRLKGLGGKERPQFHHVHVVGAGVMGGDIAAWSALRGMTVTLQDRSPELIQPALDRARSLFDKRLKDPAAAAAARERLAMDPSGEGVSRADVVIEAIYENPDAKRALYAQLEPRLKPGAVFATNTSSLQLETLCTGLADPGRLVGIHFFNPVAQMLLVEIVHGAGTRSDAAQSALAFTRALDKLPLPCRSSPGFLVNRILMPYINEAIFALTEGIPASIVDAAGRRFGMPMGPLELADVVGLDVCLHVGEVLAAAFQRTVPAVLTERVAARQFGRKSGQGFYRWQDGEPQRPASDPGDIPADLEDRLILPMLNEAVACLREGVVADADLLDAGAIFATGFAPFRGGPLRYARERGVAVVRTRLGQLQAQYGDRFRPDPGWENLPL
jgi:3-hydroxyacyl-CoA dehydrogenase/enoyl-CoA hydratase/3-hydroxybutyryl-CoA epimerase